MLAGVVGAAVFIAPGTYSVSKSRRVRSCPSGQPCRDCEKVSCDRLLSCAVVQAYMVCELQEKVNVVWSFIKTHLRSKIIVFLSTCKQVKFMYEAFKKLRPGVPLRSLHGKMKQFKRMAVFYDFCEVCFMQRSVALQCVLF